MIVAGIGCRKACPGGEIVALVRRAEVLTGAVDKLAAPAFKRGEPGVQAAADSLGVPVVFVTDAALASVQAQCVTRSSAAERHTGLASVAEAAALAIGGSRGRLLLPRIASERATCAIAEVP